MRAPLLAVAILAGNLAQCTLPASAASVEVDIELTRLEVMTATPGDRVVWLDPLPEELVGCSGSVAHEARGIAPERLREFLPRRSRRLALSAGTDSDGARVSCTFSRDDPLSASEQVLVLRGGASLAPRGLLSLAGANAVSALQWPFSLTGGVSGEPLQVRLSIDYRYTLSGRASNAEVISLLAVAVLRIDDLDDTPAGPGQLGDLDTVDDSTGSEIHRSVQGHAIDLVEKRRGLLVLETLLTYEKAYLLVAESVAWAKVEDRDGGGE